MISSVLMSSLKYKNEAFKEEQEWRLFFNNRYISTQNGYMAMKKLKQ